MCGGGGAGKVGGAGGGEDAAAKVKAAKANQTNKSAPTGNGSSAQKTAPGGISQLQNLLGGGATNKASSLGFG